MSNLFNIDLKGHTPEEQINKIEEEETEFDNALIEFRDRKANISETKERELREHAIEEFWDMIQANLGLMKMYGISAYEVQEGYTKHHKKMDKRGYKPRAKESEE